MAAEMVVSVAPIVALQAGGAWRPLSPGEPVPNGEPVAVIATQIGADGREHYWGWVLP